MPEMDKDITWDYFFELVKKSANKGDTLDDYIPEAVFQALRTLEQNWSYKWNEKMLQFTIEETSDNPNILELPSDFKSVVTLNLSTSDFENCYRTLQAQDPEHFSFSRSSEPYGFWIQNNRWLWLDGMVEGGTSGVLWYNAFTLRSSMVEGATCGMLKYGVQALLGMTMQNLAAYCREESWFNTYGRLTEIGLKTLHIADAELRRASETGSFGGLDE